MGKQLVWPKANKISLSAPPGEEQYLPQTLSSMLSCQVAPYQEIVVPITPHKLQLDVYYLTLASVWITNSSTLKG